MRAANIVPLMNKLLQMWFLIKPHVDQHISKIPPTVFWTVMPAVNPVVTRNMHFIACAISKSGEPVSQLSERFRGIKNTNRRSNMLYKSKKPCQCSMYFIPSSSAVTVAGTQSLASCLPIPFYLATGSCIIDGGLASL